MPFAEEIGLCGFFLCRHFTLKVGYLLALRLSCISTFPTTVCGPGPHDRSDQTKVSLRRSPPQHFDQFNPGKRHFLDLRPVRKADEQQCPVRGGLVQKRLSQHPVVAHQQRDPVARRPD